MDKKTMTVGELKEFINNLPDDMEIYITSNDDMPLKIVSDISSEERVGYYKELYIEVEDANKNLGDEYGSKKAKNR